MTTTLTSMAVLKVNADRYGQNALDNFLPMVLDRLYHSNNTVVSLADLRKAIGEEYGLWIPNGALQTLTRKGARQRLLRREAGSLHIDRKQLTKYDLSSTRAKVRRAHSAVIRSGVQFSRDRYERLATPDAFEAALDGFIQRNAAPLLSTIVDGKPLVTQQHANRPADDIVIASFVAELEEGEPALFEHLTDVVKGSVLATALYFQTPETFSQRLTRLEIYLDTKLLLRAIGACGPELQAVASEIIALGAGQGAKMLCFTHTLKEMEGILQSCTTAVRRPNSQPSGEASAYMISAGWEYSDAVAFLEDLERNLAKVGIRVVEKPDHDERLTLDEDRLERLLQDTVGYQRTDSRRKDVDSITAVYRLRRGYETTRLANARAIFVTTNSRLVDASRQYQNIEESDRQTVPICAADHLIVSILWLMSPLQAPDLPVRSLLADSYATMRVDIAKWQQYVERIAGLKERSSVTDQEYILLRDSLQVRALIVVDTDFRPESFTENRARAVLQKARESLAAEAIDAARTAQESEVQARTALSRERAEKVAMEEARDRVLRAKNFQLLEATQRLARYLAIGILVVVACASVVGAVYSVPGMSDQQPEGIIGVAVTTCTFLLALFSLVSLFTGHGFPWAAQYLQHRLEKPIGRWLLGIDVGDHERLESA